MKEIVMKIVSVNMVKAKSIEKKTLCMYLLKCLLKFIDRCKWPIYFMGFGRNGL